MLVLSVKLNDRVFITTPDGYKIEVQVTRTGHNGLGLGFTADSSVVIDREKIHRAKQADRPLLASRRR